MTQAGAGGNWPRYNEKPDPSIIKQKEDTCVSAVGEMLAAEFGIEISQDVIIENIGPLANSKRLADFFNKFDSGWVGGHVHPGSDENLFIFLANRPFLAIFRDGHPLGHAVLVSGRKENGDWKIADPWDQMSYNMNSADFQRILSEVVFKKVA